MNIVLWILQVLLGLAFIGAGFVKATQPLDKISGQMTFVKVFPAPFVRFIGIAELLGGIGLIIPALTGIWPWLTPVAAVGLAIIMIGAVGYHIVRSEYSRLAPTIVLAVLALVIVYGRFVLEPFN